MTTMSDNPLQAFREYRSLITMAYDRIEEALEANDFTTAADLMSAVTQTHARTSVSLRAVLTNTIKDKL